MTKSEQVRTIFLCMGIFNKCLRLQKQKLLRIILCCQTRRITAKTRKELISPRSRVERMLRCKLPKSHLSQNCRIRQISSMKTICGGELRTSRKSCTLRGQSLWTAKRIWPQILLHARQAIAFMVQGSKPLSSHPIVNQVMGQSISHFPAKCQPVLSPKNTAKRQENS